jgi:hypothetical protein
VGLLTILTDRSPAAAPLLVNSPAARLISNNAHSCGPDEKLMHFAIGACFNQGLARFAGPVDSVNGCFCNH